MVYLLHFDPPLNHVRHYAGATSDPTIIRRLDAADVSALQIPIVVSALERGVSVRLARAWHSVYSRADELPHRRDRRNLCPICLAESVSRRRT